MAKKVHSQRENSHKDRIVAVEKVAPAINFTIPYKCIFGLSSALFVHRTELKIMALNNILMTVIIVFVFVFGFNYCASLFPFFLLYLFGKKNVSLRFISSSSIILVCIALLPWSYANRATFSYLLLCKNGICINTHNYKAQHNNSSSKKNRT